MEPGKLGKILLAVGTFCLIMGILQVTELNRFTPFYTSVKCSNLFIDVPMKYTMHVTPTMVNGTMTDGDYRCTVMGGANGAMLADTGNTVSATNPQTSVADFEAAPYVPVPTTCQNDNEFEITMFDESVGRVLMANAATPNDYSTYFPIGYTTVIGDQVLPVQGSGVVTMGLKMQTNSAQSKGLFAAVGVAQPGVTGVCQSNCVAPLFFDLKFKSVVEGTTLGMSVPPVTRHEDMLPKKFCAQYAKFRADNNGDAYLSTAGPTYCRDTAADIIALITSADKHAEAVAGTAGPSVANPTKGHIDHMDPRDEELLPVKNLIMGLLYAGIIGNFAGWVILWAFGAYKLNQASQAPPAGAADGDIENAA